MFQSSNWWWWALLFSAAGVLVGFVICKLLGSSRIRFWPQQSSAPSQPLPASSPPKKPRDHRIVHLEVGVEPH